jgi:hypothetical protein
VRSLGRVAGGQSARHPARGGSRGPLAGGAASSTDKAATSVPIS